MVVEIIAYIRIYLQDFSPKFKFPNTLSKLPEGKGGSNMNLGGSKPPLVLGEVSGAPFVLNKHSSLYPMLCLFSQILVPERAPEVIKAVHRSPFKAKIEWRQIDKTEWRDSKIEYVVKYRLKYTESEYQEEVSSKSNVELNI